MGPRDHTVGKAACLLPVIEGLCVKSICQPWIGGKWCKTARALIPACASLLTFCGPDLSPRLAGILRAGYWTLGLDTVIGGTLCLFFKLGTGGPIVCRLNTDITSSALSTQLPTWSSTQSPG